LAIEKYRRLPGGNNAGRMPAVHSAISVAGGTSQTVTYAYDGSADAD